MSRIIGITNQKGGTGKTTTAVNLAASLAVFERQTLLIDCDPQGNASSGLGAGRHCLRHGLSDALMGRVEMGNVIVTTELDCLRLIPANFRLHRAAARLSAAPDGHRRLRRLIEALPQRFDYIILDSPPSLGLMAIVAILASDWLLIPTQCRMFAFEGVRHLLMQVSNLHKRYGRDIRIAGLLSTMPEERPGHRPAAERLFRGLKEDVIQMEIPRDPLLGDAADSGMPALLCDIHSPGARAYMRLAAALIRRNQLT